jgi:hypothetical protein
MKREQWHISLLNQAVSLLLEQRLRREEGDSDRLVSCTVHDFYSELCAVVRPERENNY